MTFGFLSQLNTLTIGLGLSLIACLYYLIKKGKKSNYIDSANIMLGGNGIVGGLKVGYIGIANSIQCDFGEMEQLYILLGGVAVVWASYTSVAKLFLADQTVG